MKLALFLNVIVLKCAAIFQLFTSKDQALLVWRDTLLVLDLAFDVVNSFVAFHFEGNSLSSERYNMDLHSQVASSGKTDQDIL